MAEKANGFSPQGIGFHRLPQIPTMSRNIKIAQSKNSLKTEVATVETIEEGAVIHIEGTDTVVKINSDGVTEETPQIPEPEDNQKANSEGTKARKPRQRKKTPKAEAAKLDSSSQETGTPKGNAGKKSAGKETPNVESGKKGRRSAGKTPTTQENQKKTPRGSSVKKAGKTDTDKSETDTNSANPSSALLNDILSRPVAETALQPDLSTAASSAKPASVAEMNTSVVRDILKKANDGEKKDASDQQKEKIEQTPEIPKMYFSSAGRILPRTVLLRESEKPSDSQLAKMKEGSTNDFNDMLPIKWHIGDVVWGHVSGHPWWPGMVSSDPFSGLFTSVTAGARMYRLYFVQYFGDEAERGWVRESASMAFEGRKKFEDMGDAQIKVTKDKGSKRKLIQAFCPHQRRKAPWDLAVDEAEDALKLDKEECIDKYTFVYEFLPNKRPPKTPTTPTATATSSSSQVSPEKRGIKRKEPDSDSGDETDEYEPASAPKRQRRDVSTPQGIPRRGSREEGSFETYCIKHREAVREEHPEYTGGLVIEALKQQWALMTPQQRLRYKSKFSTSNSTAAAAAEPMEEDLSLLSDSDKRRSRPTPKKMEAEGEKGDKGDIKRGRKRKAAEDEQTPSETTASVKSRGSNDSDSNSDPQEEPRPRGRLSKSTDEDYVLEIFKLNNTAPTKKENLCGVCDKNGELMECQGVCQAFFHPACVALEAAVADYKCTECTSGEHQCFSCKKVDKDAKRCTVAQCGKFYHEECAKKLTNAKVEGKGFTCPHHTCATCSAESPRNPKAAKGRLYRCVKCPTAYHVGDFCVAAGSILLGGYHILCSNHFQPVKTHKHHLRINVSWCFGCSKGGSLVCCETCPAAFHAECAGLNSMPEDAWYCSDCLSGKKPLYGDIIWIKIGNYRWWPAEICHPRNVPTNIQEMPHSVGEFPARFFGSHDYYWTHQGRVFLFQEGDRGSKDTSASRGLFKMYYKGVNEATEAFKQWKKAKENKEQIEQERNDRKPAHFKFIKQNVPVGNVQMNKADLSEIPHCECKPDHENPCGSDTECLNRMLMYECHPNVCPAKEACRNQRFQKREYPECAPYRTESRGWGLKTLVDIKKGQFVNEYVGDLIDEEECKKRIKQAHEDNITNFYMLTVDKNRIIDAGPKGNNSRFMNHSCEPNLETQKWMVNGDMRVGLFAVNDIAAGSELTFNYNLECLGNEKTKCVCGSEICSGFLGVRPKTQAAMAVEKKKKEKEGKKKKKRKNQEPRKEHEDECFRCGEGGELVMCDKPNCPKVYHLQCLNLAKPPYGKWLCPWHHCDVCGKLATKLCTECPNSFCQQHEEGVITPIKDKLICAEHTDLIEGLAASVTSESSSCVDSDDSADSEPAEKNVKEEGQELKEELKEEPMEEEKEESCEGKKDSGPVSVEDTSGNTDCALDKDAIPDKAAANGKGNGVETASTHSDAGSTSSKGDNSNKGSNGEGKQPRRPRSAQSGKKAGAGRNAGRGKASKLSDGGVPSPLPPGLADTRVDSDNDSNGLVIDLPSL